MRKKNENPSVIGQRYFYGDSGRRNYRKAFLLLLEAALAGDVHPQNLVGFCYDSGLGVKKDSTQAVFWYQRAARHRHKEAICNLAIAYDIGRGTEPNPCKAFLLYKKAVLLGDAWAQCNLGVCYLNGFGTKQDSSKGICWLRRAARKGDAKAQYNLGLEYLSGKGVRPSKRFAKLWLEKAAAQNHRQAARLLRHVKQVIGREAGTATSLSRCLFTPSLSVAVPAHVNAAVRRFLVFRESGLMITT